MRRKQNNTAKEIYKITPDKDLGQHFVGNIKLLQRELGYANVNKQDVVLEIGAGPGNLTELLAQKAGNVIALETDQRFRNPLENLSERYGNITVIMDDALEVELPEFNKVVSNLPYRIALPLIFKILQHDFEIAVLGCQERLAKRICALPKESGYSRISVTIQRVASAEVLEKIKRIDFCPPPEVDSVILRIQKIKPKFQIPDEKFFKQFLEYMFFKRNSSIRQVLKGLMVKNELISKLPARISSKKVVAVTPKEFGIIADFLWKNKIVLPVLSETQKRRARW